MAEGEVRVEITADSSGLNKGVDDAKKKLGELGSTAESTSKTAATGMGNLSTTLKGVGAAAGIAAAAAVVAGAAYAANLVNEARKAADEHAKLARQLGISNTELATLKRAAELAGIETGNLVTATRTLLKAANDAADGTGAAADTFERLGIVVEDFVELGAEDQMRALGAAMEGVTNRTERAAIATQLFGRSGLQMLNLLEDVDGTLGRARDEVERFGLSLDEIDSRKIEELNDNLSGVGAVLKGMAGQVAATLARPLAEAAGSALQLLGRLSAALAEQQALNRARQAISRGEATLDQQRKVLLEDQTRITNELIRLEGVLIQGRRPEQQIANLQRERDAVRDMIRVVEQQISVEAMRSDANTTRERRAAEETARRLAEEAEKAAIALDRQTRLREAYAQTREGQLEAIKNSIAFFETFEPRGPMATAILRDLNDELARFTNEAPESGKMFAVTLDTKIADAKKAKDDIIFAEQQANWQREAQEQAHQDKLTQIAKEASDRRMQLQMQATFGIASALISAYGDIASAVEKDEEKLFNIRKGAAIASAIVNTAQGITAALGAAPPPFNFALAGAVGIAGAAQIAAIASQSYKGGGTGRVPSPGQAPAAPSQGGGGGSQQQRSLLIQGDFDSSSLYSGEAIRRIIDQIAEAQKDGYKVVL